MAYRVEISPAALADIEQAFHSIARQSTGVGYKWFGDTMAEIYSLEAFPERCSIIPEDEEMHLGIRRHTCGRGRMIYHLYFHIVSGEDPAVQEVRIIRVRHAARDTVSRREIQEGLNG